MSPSNQPSGKASNSATNDTWIDREPTTMPLNHPPDNAYTGRFAASTDPSNNPYTQPVQQILPTKKKRSPLFFMGVFVVLIILGAVGFFGATHLPQLLHPAIKNSSAIKTTQTTQQPIAQPQGVFHTFTKNTDHSLIVMQGSKQIAAQSLPTGKTMFSTLAATDKAVLVIAYSGSINDAAPYGYLITMNGTVTPLTASITASVSKTGSSGYLDENNNFLAVTCKDTSCTLNSTNLTTGAVAPPVATQEFTPGTQPTTSLTLLGISPQNDAYYITYSKNNQNDPLGTLTSLSLASGSVKKSLIMQKAALNPPVFSPDFSHALYTQARDGATGQLVTWSDGTTAQVSGTIGNGSNYLWSPDGSQALFLNSPHDQTSTLGTVGTNGTQTVLKTFPTSATVGITILGWLDNKTIEYDISTSTTPNNFTGAQIVTHTYDVTTSADQQLTDSQTLLPITTPLASS